MQGAKGRRGLETLNRRRSRHGAGAHLCCRVQLEALESRWLFAVFNVNSTADILDPPKGVVTLRSAIEAANATPGNNTINLRVPGVYAITLAGALEDHNQSGDFDIIPNPASAPGSTLTIQNTSHGAVIVDGNHLDRVFDINPAGTSDPATRMTVVMRGFTIFGGDAFDPANPDALGSAGGGIRDQGNASLTLTKMAVTGNVANSDGGGVVMGNTVNSSWTLTINNSIISNNHAGDAGGGIDTDGAGTVVINPGTVIAGNTDLHQGAGVYIDALQVGSDFVGANMTMTGTIVRNNAALAVGITSSGGGISNAGNGTMILANCTVTGNSSNGTGGGFSDENNQGTLVVLNSLFRNNFSTSDGGAIQEGGPSTTITNSEFLSNQSGGNGGALFVNSPTLTLTASTFAYNTAAGNGGAVELQTTGTGTADSAIVDSTFIANNALDNGGANGGAIDAPDAFTGVLTLRNDTIHGNFATNGGGIFWSGAAGSFILGNTIVARNFAADGTDANNAAGTFTDLGGNLIGVSGAGSGNTGFTASSTLTGTVATPLAPLLGGLSDNGGPVVGALGATFALETAAPLLHSPAIGNGLVTLAPATDERGLPSVVKGKANIGAVSATRGHPHHFLLDEF